MTLINDEGAAADCFGCNVLFGEINLHCIYGDQDNKHYLGKWPLILFFPLEKSDCLQFSSDAELNAEVLGVKMHLSLIPKYQEETHKINL